MPVGTQYMYYRHRIYRKAAERNMMPNQNHRGVLFCTKPPFHKYQVSIAFGGMAVVVTSSITIIKLVVGLYAFQVPQPPSICIFFQNSSCRGRMRLGYVPTLRNRFKMVQYALHTI